MTPWRVLDLGTRAFHDVWAQQLALVDARQRGEGEDTLIVVEHPHVFTLGRRRTARDNVLAPGDVEIVEIERGGDATYHGPGQLVCYPIVALQQEAGERDLHKFLRRLEDAVIATCARVGIEADREPEKTGVWTTSANGARKKLCSMGIACRKWITFHGLALNVTTDLGYFARINPCGFEASVMSSLAAERPDDHIDVERVRGALVDELGRALGRASP